MDALTLNALRTVEAAAKAIEALPMVGAQAYIAGFRAKPIVDKHFTVGNTQRYGWAPLSFEYFKAKQGQVKALRKGMREAGRTVSNAEPNSARRYGAFSGLKGGNLPTLVRTGALREAVTSRTHRVERQGDVAIIVFANLPEYAIFHHTGAGRLPKRSPVEPSATDMAEVHAAMTQFLDRAIGTGQNVPVSGTTIPGVARFRPS